jgi:hypothetical protein
VLRKIFGPKMATVTSLRKPHNEKLCDCTSYQILLWYSKEDEMSVACGGKEMHTEFWCGNLKEITTRKT